MHALLMQYSFSDQRELLPRPISELYENLQQFYVMEHDGAVVGTCALYVTWDNLAEIKALAVQEAYRGKGLGKQLMDACIQDAHTLGIGRLFTLTLRAGFFERFGFQHVAKDQLPHKVWTECVRCVYFPNRCVEYAMVLDLVKGNPTLPTLKAPEAGWPGGVPGSTPLPQASLIPSEPPKDPS